MSLLSARLNSLVNNAEILTPWRRGIYGRRLQNKTREEET